MAGSRRAGFVIALCSAATFATSGVFARALLTAGWSPGAAVTVRVAGGALALLVPVILALRAAGPPSGIQIRRLTGYGVVAVAGAQACYFAAVRYLTPGIALLLEYLGPVLLVGWMWVRHRRRPGAWVAVGIGVCLLGLFLVLDPLGAGSVSLDPRGVTLALAAAVCLAVYFAMSARTHEALPAVVMVGGGLAIGAVTLAGMAVIGILPLRFTANPVPFGTSTVPWPAPALGLVLVSTVASFLTGVVASRRLGPTAASFFGLTEVAFAVLWAALLLGEVPGPVQLIGGSVLLAGVALVQAAHRPQTATATAGDPAGISQVDGLPAGDRT